MATFVGYAVIFVVIAVGVRSDRELIACYRGLQGDTTVESCAGSCVTVYAGPELGVFCSTITFPNVCFEAEQWKACFCNENLCNSAVPSSRAAESLLWSTLMKGSVGQDEYGDVQTNNKNAIDHVDVQ